jgi:hypothetical protein
MWFHQLSEESSSAFLLYLATLSYAQRVSPNLPSGRLPILSFDFQSTAYDFSARDFMLNAARAIMQIAPSTLLPLALNYFILINGTPTLCPFIQTMFPTSKASPNLPRYISIANILRTIFTAPSRSFNVLNVIFTLSLSLSLIAPVPFPCPKSLLQAF